MLQMKMKKSFTLSFISAFVFLFTLCFITSYNFVSRVANVNATEMFHVLKMNKNTNRIGSGALAVDGENGSGIVTTALGNNININYQGFTNITTQWQSVCVDGYFYNTTPISGMNSISLKRGNNASMLSITWSGSSDFAISSSQELEFTDNVAFFNFNDEHPNYFKIKNSSNSNKALISSIDINYSCTDMYKELSVQSENKTMGQTSGSGFYHVGNSVTINAYPKNGYKFIGWYKDNTLVSEESNYTFLMHEVDSTYIAKFTYISYNVVTNKNVDSYGEVTGSGTYDYLSTVSVSATPNIGYIFVGWFLEFDLVSSDLVYSFTMPHNDLNLLAKFEIGYFEAKAVSEDTNKGTVTGSMTDTYNTEVTFIASPMEGYSFAGWYDDNDNLVTTLNPFNFNMPNNDITYTAKWTTNAYEVVLTKNNDSLGSVQVVGGTTHPYNTEVTIVSSTSNPEEYTFGGWYQGETLISLEESYTFTMPYNNIAFEARYVKLHEVFIEYAEGDSSMGTFSGQGKYGEGLSYTIKAFTSKLYYGFNGWYDESLDLVSLENELSFVMGDNDVYYYASFEKALPKVGDCFELGDYPQTKVTSPSLITTLNSLAGTLPTSSNSQKWKSYNYYINGSTSNFMWYQDIAHTDGNIYRGVYFTSYRPYFTTNSSSTSNSYQDENGYYTSTVYWFRFEPITWIIKDIDLINGKALLMSKTLIDSQQFYRNTSSRTLSSKTVYANNYEHSDIRAFLNDTFYNTSFSSEEKNMILTTTIDNSGASTGNTSNSYACNNTNDKVFIPSYVEAFNSSYFTSNSARQMKASDYAKSQGIYVYLYDVYSSWWLRSPGSDYSDRVRSVDNDGHADVSRVYYCYYGVLPALWVSL